MANDLSVNINVTDNGSTAKLTKEALKLKAGYEGVAAAARIPLATQAAQQGLAAKRSAATSGGVASDTNLSRGISGVTGASGRDFAAQAQGLGGLVHVYATFAANLFAVSAAFTALSKAADLSNMVKGLDQIGAQSGRSLGTLAKRLTEVTDNAISMKESLSATALASAGGMSNSAILRMGMVAKQAALALGRDMPDAMERLSKGIVKTQPELLDELGIMTRVIPAQQEYAKSIGKSLSALTEFEKKQAFANAVLAEGEAKFGAIQLSANPYSKILASLSNISFKGLEVVNSILSPIVSLLSSSPTALGLTMAWIAQILIKQAIPAIGQWREGLVKTAQQAGITASRINDSFSEFKRSEHLGPGLRLEAIAKSYMSASADAIRGSNLFGKTSVIYRESLKTDAEFTNKHLASVQNKLTNTSNTILDLNAKKITSTDANEIATINTKIDSLNKLNTKYQQVYNTMSMGVKKAAEAKHSLDIGESVSTKDPSYLSEEAARARIAKSQMQKYSAASVIANVGINTQEMGMRSAFKALWKDINTTTNTVKDANGEVVTLGRQKLEGITKASTLLSGSTRILASGISTIASSLGTVGMVAGVAVAAFQLLDNWLTTSAKEAEAFIRALTTVEDAVANVSRTLEALSKKKPIDVIDIASTQARATAFNELSLAAEESIATYKKLTTAWSGWDKFTDWFADGFGVGAADKLSTSLSRSIIAAMSTAGEGNAKDSIKKRLQSILGNNIDVTNIKELEKALKGLNDEELRSKSQPIVEQIAALSREANSAASVLTGLKESFAATTKTVQEHNASLNPSDFFSKIGASLISDSTKLHDALKSPIDSLKSLNELVKDTAVLTLLPTNTVTELLKDKVALDKLTSSLGDNEKAAISTQAAINKIKSDGKYSRREDTATGIKQVLTKEAISLESSVAQLFTQRALLEKASVTISEKFKELDKTFLVAGIENLNKSLKGAMEEGAIIAAKGFLSVLKFIGGNTAEQETRLALQQLDIQAQLIKSNYESVLAQRDLTIATENVAARLAIQEATAAMQGKTSDAVISKYEQVIKDSQHILDVNSKISGIQKSGAGNIVASANALKDPKNKLDDLTKEALNKASPLFAALFSMEGQLAKISGQKIATNYQGEITKVSELVAEHKRLNEQKIQSNSVELESINNAISLKTIYDSELQTRKAELEASNLKLSSDSALFDINSKIALGEKLSAEIKDKNSTKYKDTEKAISILKTDRQNQETQYLNKLSTSQLNNYATSIKGEESIRQINSSRLLLERSEVNALSLSKLDIRGQELAYLKEIGAIENSSYITQQKEVDIAKQYIQAENELNTIKDQGAKKEREALIALNIVKEANRLASSNAMQMGLDAPKAISTAQEQAAYDSAVSSTARLLQNYTLINNQKLLSISRTAEYSQLLANQAESIAKMVSLTDSLTTAFGSIGDSIGKAGQSMLKFVNTEQLHITKKKALEESLKDGLKTDKQREKITESIGELDRKNTVDKLDGISDIMGNTKKMFAEHTGAYKILGAVEKATAIASMALKAEQMAVDLATLPAKIAGGVASLFSQGGFAGFVGAGAFLALMAGLGFGGGSVTMPSGFTAEEQQKVQGTGQYYNNGKLVNTIGGALGDATKKSTSLEDSITSTSAYTKSTMEYSNKMLVALLAIKSNTENFAKSLAHIPGITTQPDTISGGNWLTGTSSTETLDKGITAAGTIGGFIKGQGTLGQYTNTKSSSSGFLGLFGGGTSYNTTTDKVPTNVGKQLMDAMAGMFSSVYAALGAAAETLSGAQTSEGKLAASNIAKSVMDTVKIDPEQFKLSTMGLKGTELSDAVANLIGEAMDQAAATAFPEIDKFRNLGEGMAATVARMARETDVVNLQLESMGTSLTKFVEVGTKATASQLQSVSDAEKVVEVLKAADNTMAQWNASGSDGGWWSQVPDPSKVSILADAEQALADARAEVVKANTGMTTTNLDIIDNLVKLAGGLDAFNTKSQYFIDNFLTEAEKLAPVQARVSAEMERLHYSSITTIEGFKNLVKGFDLTVPAQQETYTALMNVAEGFYTVYGAATKLAVVLNDADLAAAKLDQIIKIQDLLGNSETVLSLTRGKELDGMDERLKANQRYIYALEDEKIIKDKLVSALKGNLSSIQGFITSIKSTKDALLLGANSTLTPAEKYTQAKSQMEGLAALSNSSDLTARNDALSKLPAATTTFLDASKQLYASSDKYAIDFKTVSDLLDRTGASLQAQESEAQKQLTALNSMDTSLTSINDLMLQLVTAQTASANASVGTGALMSRGATADTSTITGTTGTSMSFTTLKNQIVEALTYDSSASMATKLYDNFIKNGISSSQVAEVLGKTQSEVLSWSDSYNLPKFATGGWASGMSIVGEQGPELVDFRTPGRVYSNKASNDLLSNTELVQEIKNLRQEVAQLRADQKEQTGHLIASNYDANNKAANKISDATETASSNTTWVDRSKVKIA